MLPQKTAFVLISYIQLGEIQSVVLVPQKKLKSEVAD